MFNGAEDSLKAKDQSAAKIEGNLRTNTNLMYAYELEKDRLAVLLTDAEKKVQKVTSVNEQVTLQIAQMSKYVSDNENTTIAEIKKNRELHVIIA
jgi:hypothetical protein